MTIGIHAVAAFKEERTGVEEYCFQLIRHMAALPEAKEHCFVLYVRRGSQSKAVKTNFPENFKVRELWAPYLWTQVRLSIEVMHRAPDVLFIPAHVLPLHYPARTVVTIHGLEFEYFPKHYPFIHRRYLQITTQYALKHALRIIVPSTNTKKDLIKLYGGNEAKITEIPFGSPKVPLHIPLSGMHRPYLLYLGRIETRKNVHRLVAAFQYAMHESGLPHSLILAGGRGYGYKTILGEIASSVYAQRIHLLGYVSEEKKWSLLKHADLFLFPSLYEGFGIPVLEAQRAGTPVLTSKGAVFEEVAGKDGALFVDPFNIQSIAQGIIQGITNAEVRRTCVREGKRHSEMFSWERAARETLQLLVL